MSYLDFGALAKTPLTKQPFDYVIVPNFVKPEAFRKVVSDFPDVPGAGSHPPAELKIRGHFAELIKELHGDAFRKAVEEKFDIDLSGRPTMYTVRGFLRKKDGSIHTDSTTKIITVLLYLNEDWDFDGGRLRLLNNGTDLEDYVTEVPPVNGTLLVFRRSDNSWHGHKPYEGRRRAIQFNWVTEAKVVTKEQSRHRLSTRLKKIKSFFLPSAA
ncbi:2OG-Fe(II) oxygenase [Microvirga terricola]|uniref:2OG-Fe(II) oxygenase n=1 Tax=Microvirga terricola TaxID=2719797 RepID=A0ABX0VAT4_9HYPH|nr:2OG-Fe(II) oxygenase [Microvirga terricola]NIX75511.1 2OG-Fe(II) oxygenase [Microvirga terricola]